MNRFFRRVLVSPIFAVLIIVSIICWIIDFVYGWIIMGDYRATLREGWEQNETLNKVLDFFIVWSEHTGREGL